LPGSGLALEKLLKYCHLTGRHIEPGFSMPCLPPCNDK
jgi:hypothetical protein